MPSTAAESGTLPRAFDRWATRSGASGRANISTSTISSRSVGRRGRPGASSGRFTTNRVNSWRVAWVLGPDHGAYHDIDACPSLTHLIAHRGEAEIGAALEWAVGKRPESELYAIAEDPGCLTNLAADPKHADVVASLRDRLFASLRRTGDLRVTGAGDVWETYPRVSGLRWFPTPDWAREAPQTIPEQPWLEARRPRQ